MQSVMDRLIKKTRSATIHANPSDNFYLNEIFMQTFYTELLARLLINNEYDLSKCRSKKSYQ